MFHYIDMLYLVSSVVEHLVLRVLVILRKYERHLPTETLAFIPLILG